MLNVAHSQQLKVSVLPILFPWQMFWIPRSSITTIITLGCAFLRTPLHMNVIDRWQENDMHMTQNHLLARGTKIFDISQQSILMLVWLGCTGNPKMRVGSRMHLSHPITLGAKQSQQPGHILSEQTSDVRASWPEQNQSWWRSGCFGKRGGGPSSFQHRQIKINNFPLSLMKSMTFTPCSLDDIEHLEHLRQLLKLHKSCAFDPNRRNISTCRIYPHRLRYTVYSS